MCKIIDFLKLQLGNTGEAYWNWYTDNVNPAQGYFVNDTVTPWCAEFVTCMLEWTDSQCVWFPNSCAFDAGNIPVGQRYYAQSIRPLDVIAFDWDSDTTGDHVGIVLDVFDWGCRTIEGNSGSVVATRNRYWDTILFGIRPDWGDEEVTEQDKRDIARYCAEYVYGDEDKREGLNMYNTLHWGFWVVKKIESLCEKILATLESLR